MSDDYDYTKDDDGPPPGTFGAEADDFEIGSTATAEVDPNSLGYRDAPLGKQKLVIKGFLLGTKDKSGPNMIGVALPDGRRANFVSQQVTVNFALASDLGAGVSDRFLLPPNDPAEFAAYWTGCDPNRPMDPQKNKPGFQAAKFCHFLTRLGFAWEKGQNFPEQAKRLGNWKLLPDFTVNGVAVRRTIYAKVVANRYQDKKTGAWKDGVQVGLFSYEMSEEVARALGRPVAAPSPSLPLGGQSAAAQKLSPQQIASAAAAVPGPAGAGVSAADLVKRALAGRAPGGPAVQVNP